MERKYLKMKLLIIVGLLVLIQAVPSRGDAPSTVQHDRNIKVTSQDGVFYGHVYNSARDGRKIYAFTGIPFAKKPLGPLRFKPPQKPDYLESFDAYNHGPECIQYDHLLGRGVIGSEDCLYLNIYTKKIPEAPKYHGTAPVLLFLHAGSWMAGSGASDIFTPDYLIENDVTMVTMNHRLGPIGFLTSETEDAPGNVGLLDQIRALEWIRDNSRYFGGMNDSVTVMGSGAGGISAHLLTLTPRARGASTFADEYVLLKRAISQSGTAYSPYAIMREPLLEATYLAKRLQCPGNEDIHGMITCLRIADADKMLKEIPFLFIWDEEPIPFGPVVDKKWMGSNAVIPDEPFHLIKHGEFLQIPWIVGTNKEDGAFRVQDILKDPVLVKQLNTNWKKFGPTLLHLTKHSCKDPVEVATKIRDFYMEKHKFGQHSEKEFIEMMTDRFFLYPTEMASKDHSKNLVRKDNNFVYRYELHFAGKKTFLDILQVVSPTEEVNAAFGNPRFQNIRDARGLGVSFLDELIYLFPSPKLGFSYVNSFAADEASQVSAHMLMLWSNFIKGGDPTPVLPGFSEESSPWGAWWEPYVRGTYYYLQIDLDMMTQETPLKPSQMEFWDSLSLWENVDHNVIRDEL